VWFTTRTNKKNVVEYTPLSPRDCSLLNGGLTTTVQHGRLTVDINTLTATNTYWSTPDIDIKYGNWFELSKDGNTAIPLTPDDCTTCEAVYAAGLTSDVTCGFAVGGELTDSRKIVITDSAVEGEGGKQTMKIRSPNSFFTPDVRLQRGYSPYVVPGVSDEDALGPLSSVIFVIHGIGETLWSREDNSMPSLVQQCDKLRIDTHKKLVEDWRRCGGEGKSPGRVEVLPIEWYNNLHSNNTELCKTLSAITIKSIPLLRTIANDVVMDVLLYQTPNFCESVLSFVGEAMNEKYEIICNNNEHFKESGAVSIIGHSLGSMYVGEASIVSLSRSNENEDSQLLVLLQRFVAERYLAGSLSVARYRSCSLTLFHQQQQQQHRIRYRRINK